MRLRFAIAFGLLGLLLSTSGLAQSSSVLASGLLNPIRITLTPRGNLLVSENGMTPNSGRISIISRSGIRTTLISGLPSGLSAPNNQPDGVTAVTLQGNTLYVVIGEGDTMVNGPRQGTSIVNPNGFSSPILSSVLKVTLSGDVDGFSGGLALKPEDHASLADGNVVWTAGSASGDSATFEILTNFSDVAPDPNTIYRNSHPFGAALTGDRSQVLYVSDAGMNTLVRVDTNTGKRRVIARFPPVPNVVPGPPVSDAVPTNVRVFGNSLLVSQLTGFPFTPGQSRVVAVDPRTGVVSPFINGLNSAVDLAVRQNPNGSAQFFVLEYSANMLAGAKGRLLRFDTAQSKVVLDDLSGPSAMAVDSATGDIFIVENAGNSVRQYKIQ